MSERGPSSRSRRARRRRLSAHINDPLACGLLGFLFLALLGLQLFGPGGTVVIDPADVPAAAQLDGVYPVEQSPGGAFRWTRPEATILAELPIHGGYQVALTVQDTPQNAAPRTLTVLLDGAVAGTVPLSGEPQTLTFRRTGLGDAWDRAVPPRAIALQTQAYQPPGDARALGVVLRAATVRALVPSPAQGLRLALVGLILLGGGYGLLRACRLGPPVAAAAVGLGSLAAYLLLILQQPFLPLHLISALADSPVALVGVAALLAALCGAAIVWPTVAPRWLLGAALALPLVVQFGLLVWMIWVEPVQVPWYDELFDAIYVWHARAGGLDWAELWQFYAAHRIPTLRLVNFLAIGATDWDRRVLLTLQVAATLLTLLALAGVLRRTVPGRGLQLALLAPIGALLFAISQYGQWLLTYGLQFHLAILGLACGMWLLSVRQIGWGRLALAIVAAWLASWSGLHGLISWVVLLPLVWRAGWAKVGMWLGCAAAVGGTYAVGFPRESVRQFDPLGLVRFTLAGLGAPLGAFQPVTGRVQFWHHEYVTLDYRPAMWIGLAGVAILALNLGALATFRDQELLWRAVPWCSLALFAAICAALTGQGRGARANIALASRYQNFAVLWWAAVVAIVALTLWRLWQERRQQRRWQRLVVGINIAAILLGAGAYAEVNLTSALVARDWHRTLRETEACARDIATAPDACMEVLHPVPTAARLRLAQLAQGRLALYRAGPGPTAPDLSGDPGDPPDLARLPSFGFEALYRVEGLPGPLDGVDGVPPPLRVPANAPLILTGRAIDATALPLSPASGLYFILDDRPPRWVPLGGERPEVARRFDAAYLRSGFRVEWPAGSLAPGEHTLRVVVVAASRRASYPPSAPVAFTVE